MNYFDSSEISFARASTASMETALGLGTGSTEKASWTAINSAPRITAVSPSLILENSAFRMEAM